jgi:hypothetical protein
LGEQGNRYGLLHRFIKKKYTNFRFQAALLTYLPDASAAAAIVGNFLQISRGFRDIGKLSAIVFAKLWLFRHHFEPRPSLRYFLSM